MIVCLGILIMIMMSGMPIITRNIRFNFTNMESNMKTIIMSGPSGCGKTTWIKRQKFGNGLILSADHYFYGLNEDYSGVTTIGVDQDGKDTFDYPFGYYNYVPGFEPITAAHRQCRKAFLNALREGIVNTLIIDNTNTSAAEKAVYYDHASDYGEVVIVRFETPLDVCIERNAHDVPEGTIQQMYERHHARDERANLVHTMPWWNTIGPDA